MNKERVLEILKSNDLQAQSKFGQNFLCNDSITERIVDVSDIRPDSKVLEIGPGIGALTETILDIGNSEMQYTAIEIDKGLATYLKSNPRFDSNVNIICSDYLKLDCSDYVDEKDYDYVVSNIPYYVMTPIMKKLLADCSTAKKMTFMVEEAAIERIIAKPKTKQYGPLAVLCANFGVTKKEFLVPSDSFYPMPHTMSAVITLTRNDGECQLSEEYESFVEACFAMRRKTLYNNLNSYLKSKKISVSITDLINKIGYSEKVRAEDLAPSDFYMLFKLMFDII